MDCPKDESHTNLYTLHILFTYVEVYRYIINICRYVYTHKSVRCSYSCVVAVKSSVSTASLANGRVAVTRHRLCSMIRKGYKKPVSQLGHVQCVYTNTDRCRVPAGSRRDGIRGPHRTCKRDADVDIKQNRKTQTREEYGDTPRLLQKDDRDDGGGSRNQTQEDAGDTAQQTQTTAQSQRHTTGDQDEEASIERANQSRGGCLSHEGNKERTRKPVSQLGGIECVGTNAYRFRVKARIDNRHIAGPYRSCIEDAETDLKQARTAQTPEEYCSILRHIQKSQRDDAVVVNEIQGSPDEIEKAALSTACNQNYVDTEPRKRVCVEVRARTRQADGDRCTDVRMIYINLEETCTGWKVAVDER